MSGDLRSTDISLLGPLEVRVGGRVVPIARPKQRSLLAVLALAPGVCVSKERLIDELWGAAPPETALHGLQVHVSGLRKLLGAGLIETCPGGYRLAVAPDAVDASRAAALIAEGRAEGDREKLAAAVTLFRGPPLAGTELEGRDAARLEDLRHEALEEQFDLELAAGAGPALVAPLERLVAESPLRERPRGQLMRALYRSGRQAEALAVFQDTRRTFVEELGIEPSPALRELEKAILQQDAELVAPAVAASAVSRRRRVSRLGLVLAFTALAATAGVAAAVLLPPGKPHAASVGSITAPPSTLVAAPVGHTTKHTVRRAVRRHPVAAGAARPKHVVKTPAAKAPAAKAPAVVIAVPVTTAPAAPTSPVTTAPVVVTTQPKVATHPIRTTPAPTPTVTTPAGPVHIVDTFDSGVVDSRTWNVLVNGVGADAVQRNGKLVISIAANAKPGGPFNFVGVQYGSRSCFSGDIDMQVDYHLVSWPPSSGAYVGLQAVFANAFVDRLSDANSSSDSIGSMIDPRWTSVSIGGTSGSLRLRRVGGVVTTYYLDSGEWQAIDTGPAPHPAHLHIGLNMNPGLSPSSNIVVELDNFSATASGPTSC